MQPENIRAAVSLIGKLFPTCARLHVGRVVGKTYGMRAAGGSGGRGRSAGLQNRHLLARAMRGGVPMHLRRPDQRDRCSAFGVARRSLAIIRSISRESAHACLISPNITALSPETGFFK